MQDVSFVDESFRHSSKIFFGVDKNQILSSKSIFKIVLKALQIEKGFFNALTWADFLMVSECILYLKHAAKKTVCIKDHKIQAFDEI